MEPPRLFPHTECVKLSAFLLVLASFLLLHSYPLFAQPNDTSIVAGPTQPSGSKLAGKGKIFGDIEIRVRSIFDPPTNALFRTANNLKIPTRKAIILQEVQFKSGDPYDEFLLYETARVLRTIRYLKDVRVIPIDRGQVVDVLVEVQDTWTVLPQFSFSSGDGRNRRSAGLSEGNLLGTGNRLEVLYKEDEGADTIQAAFDSRRLFGTKYQGQLAIDTGAEGDSFFYDVGDPFRSLPQETAWAQSGLVADRIERLFQAGDERFVYRKETESFQASYAYLLDSPENTINRFQYGFSYLDETFKEATASDFDDIGVDPEDLPENGGVLAEDRKFVGPFIGFQSIERDFIKRNYIDRFARVNDFNLGERFFSSAQWAPTVLDSSDDALLISTSYGNGYRLTDPSFFRWEIDAQSRLLGDGFQNSIFSLEGQYFYPFGLVTFGNYSLGIHTLVVRSLLDYADNFDDDKEFAAGGDNLLRGYDARTFTGDKRFGLNIEDRIHLYENIYDLVSLGMAVFADVGGATNESLGELYSDEMYADVGVGLRIAFPKSTGERVARIDIAFPLRDGPDGSDRFEIRAIFSGGQLFGARLGTERRAADRVGVDLGF